MSMFRTAKVKVWSKPDNARFKPLLKNGALLYYMLMDMILPCQALDRTNYLVLNTDLYTFHSTEGNLLFKRLTSIFVYPVKIPVFNYDHVSRDPQFTLLDCQFDVKKL